MNVAVLGTHKGMEENLVKWINEFTDWKAEGFKNSQKTWNIEPKAFDLSLGFNCYLDNKSHKTWKNISSTKNLIYITGSGVKNQWDFEMFSDALCGCASNKKEFYPEFQWLPLPFDWSNIQQADISQSKEIKVCQAVNFMQDKGQTKVFKTCKELGISYDFIYGLSYEECLKRKFQNNLVIDNFVKGNIGVTTLESLALGIPAVSGISEQAIEDWSSMGSTIPVFKTNDLKTFLMDITVEELIEKGKESRKWMEENYTPKKIAEKFINFFDSIMK